MNPFVFLVGCARSGTTLLGRIVDAHPQIAITPELHWITDAILDNLRGLGERPWSGRRKGWLEPEGTVPPDLVPALAQHKRFRQLGFTRQEFEGLLVGEQVSYVAFLNGLFDLYGRKKGKPLVGNRTPAYVQRVASLHAFWPRARFVHLIRDGREVCLSVLTWTHALRSAGRYATWAEDPVTTTALWWKRKVGLARQRGQALGPELYYEIRYENLVSRPAEECSRLCAFLGMPYDEAMLRFHEGRTRADPGLDAKEAWRPITPGLRDWRSQMPSADVERFEAAAGDLLNEIGYPRAFPHPSPEVLRHVARIRDQFTQEVCARPDCW